MKGLLYRGARDIVFDDAPVPEPEDIRSAIVKITACGICGSDLHIYQGHGFSETNGYCVGHEAVGEVIETGSAVSRFKSGDRVMISAAVGCGSCPSCMAGNVTQCETAGARCYGLGPKLQGVQAEYTMVPVADFGLAKIPDGVTEDQAVLLTDNLPTAWFGLKNADIKPGSTVAVVGCGPIGLMAVEGAFLMGAARVFAVDLVPERRQLAEEIGATAFDWRQPDHGLQVPDGAGLHQGPHLPDRHLFGPGPMARTGPARPGRQAAPRADRHPPHAPV